MLVLELITKKRGDANDIRREDGWRYERSCSFPQSFLIQAITTKVNREKDDSQYEHTTHTRACATSQPRSTTYPGVKMVPGMSTHTCTTARTRPFSDISRHQRERWCLVRAQALVPLEILGINSLKGGNPNLKFQSHLSFISKPPRNFKGSRSYSF